MLHLHLLNCLFVLIFMQEKLLAEPSSPDDSSKQAESSSSDDGLPQLPNKDLNRQIAAVSALAAVALFFSTQLDLGVSLKDLSATALPYEEVGD